MPFKSTFYSDDTIKSLEQMTENAIKKYSVEKNIEEALVKAIIEKESQNIWLVIRDDTKVLKDKKWVKDYFSQHKITLSSQPYMLWSSGLTQILFIVAHSYGFRGSFYDLMNPDENIKWGVHHMSQLQKRWKNIKDMISAYNGRSFIDINGNGVRDEDEKFGNQKYVDDVYAMYKKYGGKR